MNDKGKQFYDYLVSKDIKVPATYEEFQSAMQDSTTASKFHSFVKSKGITVPESVDEFSSVFGGIQPAQETVPDVKKKEQTKPVQEAPLPGLGGVSEEPTPSPSVGQGVLRDVDRTQPSGEAFISRASDLTRTDVREPQVDSQELTQVSEITEPLVMEEQPLPDTEDVLEKQRLYDNKMQSERNENIKKYGLDLTKGQLKDVFDREIPSQYSFKGYEIDPSKYETRLNKDEEAKFQNWLKKQHNLGNITDGDYRHYKEKGYGYNYDFRAAFKENMSSAINEVDDKPHWGDIGKKPNHPTFSNESKYHNVDGYVGGVWDGENYTPPKENIESYLSKQIGRVTSSANNIVNNPKAFGLPSDIFQMNPNEREDVVDRYIARNYEMRGNGVNMNESELRKVFNQKFDQALAKKKADRDVMLAKESDDELLKAGISQEGLKPYKLAQIKQRDVSTLNSNEAAIYAANVKLQDITSQIKSITSKYDKETGGKLISKVGGKTLDQRISELNSEGDNLTQLQEKGFTDQASLDAFNKRVEAYNSRLESINKEIESEKIKQDKIQRDYEKDQETLSKLMKEYESQQQVVKKRMSNLGDDRKIMVDYLTGQHVDKLSDDDDANITEAVNAQIVEFNQPTYKDQLDDLYIKVGLRDQRHREYGNNVTDDVTIGTMGMARALSSDAAINKLRSLGYEEVGGVGEVTFKNVSLRDQSSASVINVLSDEKRERADRWLATNKQNIIEREALKNMVLLNVDPGKFDKSLLARGVEVLAEESLPSYVNVNKALGFTSDRKLIDAALPLLQEEGIELTKEQEDNLERTFGEEATEATFGMAPVIVKLGLINSIAGPVRTISGFGNLVDKLSKSKSLVDKGIALFLDASFEEAQMQAAGFEPGTGFGFNVAGKLFKGVGLDKFPIRGKGEMARFNKSADALWNHAIKGATSAEFASNVEAVIKDFEGGETWKNFSDQNYSDLSDVTKRMLVNGIAFGVLGVRDLGFFVKKGKSGFNISNMEKARDEAQRKGYKEEADMLTKYINEYYAGKPGKAQPASYNDMKLFVENVPENESRRFTVSSLEEVPVEFRDRAKKNESVETEVDRTFLGIPLGKKKVNSGESYSYEITGKEIRELFNKKKEGKTETEFEEEFDMSQKAEEPTVGEEVMTTATTVTEPTGDIVPAKQKGRLTKFSTPKDGIVGEVTYEDGTKKELTQEEYDALEKQEGLFDVETGTQPVAETAPKELSPKQKEAYNRLTKEERDAVDELIFDEQYELSIGAKDVEKPKGLTKEESAIWDYENKIAKESIAYGDALNNALGVVAEKQKADGEVFTFGQDKYNIDKAVNLANTEGIEPVEIGIETLPKMQMPFVLKTEKGIRDADLSKPVIVATTKDGMMLIDGHHRLEKAIREGKPVKAQILSESQTLEIKETVPTEAVAEEDAPAEGRTLAEQEEIQTLIDVIDLDPKNPKNDKYKTILKDKYDYDYNDPSVRYKEEISVIKEGVELKTVKTNKGIELTIDKTKTGGLDNSMTITAYDSNGNIVGSAAFNVDMSNNTLRVGGAAVDENKRRQGIYSSIYDEIEAFANKNNLKILEVGRSESAKKFHESRIGKQEKDAIQKQAAGKVPVQPEAKAGKKMEEGKPQAEPEVAAEKGKEEVSEEDAGSEEKVKELVDKQMSDEKKQEEADKEIESKSEEELKEDVPDVLESISESEREKLDREAKVKGKSTVDYVIDYLKGKLKNVRQSIKNILEKLRSKYRELIIASSIVMNIATGASVVKFSDIKTPYDALKESAKSGIIDALQTSESFASAAKKLYESGVIKSTDPVSQEHLERALMISGNLIPESGNVISETKKDKIDYENQKYVSDQTYTEDLGSPKIEKDAAKFRVQYPLKNGREVILIPTHEGRQKSGKKQIDGISFIMQHLLDYDPINNVSHPNNSGFHRTNKSFDGFVPVLIKKEGDRGVVTYKRYSEINEATDIMMSPLRQFKFSDLDWDGEGTPIMKSAREINLKNGKKSPYRRPGLTYNGRPISEGGTDIIWTPKAEGKKGYGKFQGGSVVFIFEDSKGNRFAREFAGSINEMKAEGESIAKTFGIPTESITIGTHDVGSFSKKLRAENGVITYEDIDSMNDAPETGAAIGIPIEDTGMANPIGLMALPLLFGGTRRRRKPLADADADKLVTDWMEDVQKIYDAQKTKNKREARDQAAVNLALSGKLDNLAPDQVKAVLEGIQTETDAMGKKWSVSTLSELEGLTIKQQFKQGFEEYVAALKDKEASKKIKAEIKLQEKIDKLKEKAKEAVQNAKDDVVARKIFNEIMKAEMEELGLGTLTEPEIKNLLSMAKQADRKKIEDLIERGINLMAKAAKRNLKTGAEQVRKKLSDRIKKGDFGTADQKAIAIANIPVENIPVKRLPEYYELLNNLVSKRGKISAVDLNKVSDFIDSISEEIENKIGGLETLAELYDVFDSERKIESESEEYIEAKKLKKDERNARQQGLINRIEGKAKEEFKSFLEELGMPTEITDFANNEFEAIVKEHKRQNTEKGKPLTSAKKIEKIKEKRKQAIDNFNSLYPIEKGSRGIDVSLYRNNEVLAEAAAFFNKLGNNQLKDLLPSEINALPLIYENMNFGLMTSSVFRIMSKIKGSMTVDQMSESSSQFSRMLATSPKDLPGDVKTMAEDFTLPLYNLVKPETPTSVSIKDAKELGRRMLAEQTPYIKYLMKGIKGDPVYEMLNGLTGAMTSASSMVSDAKRKTYDLFMGMKGLPLENNMMISTFHRIREHQALNGETDIAIRRPIEYVDAKIETARTDNQGVYDLMVGIKDKYFDKNGDPKIDKLTGESLIEKEINKRGGKELVDFMDKMNEVTREMGRTIAVIRGIPYKEIDLYGASRAEHGTDNLSEKMSKITAGKTLSSVKSGAVLSRTGNTKKTFDSVGDFLSSFDNTVHEYYLTEPLSTISNFVSIANKTGNVNLARYANAIKDYVSGAIENQIKTNYSDGGFWMSLMNDIISTRKSGAVFGLGIKPFAETFSQMNKILLIPEARKSFMTGIQVLKESGDGVLNFKKAFEFMKAIQSTHQNRAGALNAEVYYQPGYFERKLKSNTGKYLNIYNKVRPLLKPTKGMKRGLQRAAEISQMAPDAFGVIQVNIGAFSEKFKELTGNYPDINRIIEDKQYRAENADAIRKARAYADKLTSSTAAPSSMAETSKAGYFLPPIRMGYMKKEPGKTQNLFILDTYSGSEKRTLLVNLKELRDSLMKPFITKGMSESWTGSEKKTSDVLQEITGRSMAGVSYQVYRAAGFAILGILISMIESALSGTDEDELDLIKSVDEGIKRGVLDQALLPLLGNASWVTRLMLLGGISVAARYAEGELEEGEEGYSEDFKEAMYVPDLNRYGNIPLAVSKLGFEGQVAADALELAIMTDNLDDFDEKDAFKLSYLLARNSAPLPQEASRGMRVLRTMEKVENLNYLMYGNKASYLSNGKTRSIYRLYEDLEFDKSVLPPVIRDKETVTDEDGNRIKYEIDKDKLDGLYNERGSIISDMMTDDWMATFRGASPKDKKELLKALYDLVNNSKEYQQMKDAYFIQRGRMVK